MEYAPDPSKRWYVLRATYQREQRALERLTARGMQVYLPLRYVERTIDGKRRRTTTPLIPSLLFVYSEAQTIDRHLRTDSSLSFINFYYNHFKTTSDGKNPPLEVPYADMMNFIRVTSAGNAYVRAIDRSQCRYRSGDLVRVVDGDFTGVVGRVARVAGQQRVVVELEGVCLVSTAYVPSAFLQKVDGASCKVDTMNGKQQ